MPFLYSFCSFVIGKVFCLGGFIVRFPGFQESWVFGF